VLDSFAGGGSIPLEALRLGCESYSMDLNPVAFLIEKATVEYPQRFGITLATDVRKWAGWVTDRVRSQVAARYPLIPMPAWLEKQAKKQGAFADGAGKSPIGLVRSPFCGRGPSNALTGGAKPPCRFSARLGFGENLPDTLLFGRAQTGRRVWCSSRW
jgi:hypothetical protein